MNCALFIVAIFCGLTTSLFSMDNLVEKRYMQKEIMNGKFVSRDVLGVSSGRQDSMIRVNSSENGKFAPSGRVVHGGGLRAKL